MKVIILAGGSGNRLYPLSNEKHPKHLLKIYSENSLLSNTVLRFLTKVKPSDIFIVTNEKYYYDTVQDIKDLEKSENNPDINQIKIISEPYSRNTAPAVALAVKYIMELGFEDETIFISPSDHIIDIKFLDNLDAYEKVAMQNKILLLGITATDTRLGLGYISMGDYQGNWYSVDKFIEKPSNQAIQNLLDNEKMLCWNSGMYIMSIKTFIIEMKNYLPKLYNQFNSDLLENFKEVENISLDYGIIEKSDKLALIYLIIKWSDIGSWDAIYNALKTNRDSNIITDGVTTIDTSNCIVMNDKCNINTIGISDLFIIENDNNILIVKKGESQRVSELLYKNKDRI